MVDVAVVRLVGLNHQHHIAQRGSLRRVVLGLLVDGLGFIHTRAIVGLKVVLRHVCLPCGCQTDVKNSCFAQYIRLMRKFSTHGFVL